MSPGIGQLIRCSVALVASLTVSCAPNVQNSAIERNGVASLQDHGSGSTIPVIIVEDSTSRPVAGALITYFVKQEIEDAFEGLGDEAGGNLDDLYGRIGHRLIANQLGRADLPRCAHASAVLATAPGLLGSAAVQESPDEIRVVLKPERFMRARALDESGVPVAGVPFGLRTSTRERIGSGVSASDGIAVIKPGTLTQLRLEQFRGLSHTEVVLTAPGLAQMQVVDLSNPPEDPIPFVIPPTGALAILLRDESDHAIDGLVTIGAAAFPQDGGNPAVTEGFSTRDGNAVFAHVALGKRYHVVGEWRSMRLTALIEVAGPREPREVVTATLVFRPNVPSFIGRLVDVNGRPLGPRSLHATFFDMTSSGHADREGTTAKADSRGRFRLFRAHLDRDDSDRIAGRWLYLATAPIGAENPQSIGEFDASAALVARVRLTHSLHKGDTDIGDVLMLPLPLIASGIVVDGEGKPFEGARIRIAADRVESTDDCSMMFDDPTTIATSTGADGSFALRGYLRSKDVTLIVERGESLLTTSTCANGSTGLRIALSKK